MKNVTCTIYLSYCYNNCNYCCLQFLSTICGTYFPITAIKGNKFYFKMLMENILYECFCCNVADFCCCKNYGNFRFAKL
ncbi:hypothetical protein HMPREF1584_00020 [Gardnerella vaginalis JCP8481A]|uniref:Uncharacterized protein n=1 Tax=Gardnerella vaginalis TaxID=2702 RepID=A0A133P313_GARVA|nr:hypothetical protein HMPREF1584_00020 [Gardnerella vaginalis JCP8481A]KXA22968.1 hypothetical protein HMPREF3208_00055 [Gardnerella vaginalis]